MKFCQCITQSLFVPITRVTGRFTRGESGKCMKVAALRSDTGRRAFSYVGPFIWNSLPLPLIEKFNEFKKSVSMQVHDLFGDHPT